MIREKRIAASLVPTPAAGTSTFFVDTDGLMKIKDDTGTVRSAASTPSGADVVNTIVALTGTNPENYTVPSGVSIVASNKTAEVSVYITLPNQSTNVGRKITITTAGQNDNGDLIYYYGTNYGSTGVKDFLGNIIFTGVNVAHKEVTFISNGLNWLPITIIN